MSNNEIKFKDLTLAQSMLAICMLMDLSNSNISMHWEDSAMVHGLKWQAFDEWEEYTKNYRNNNNV